MALVGRCLTFGIEGVSSVCPTVELLRPGRICVSPFAPAALTRAPSRFPLTERGSDQGRSAKIR